MSDILTDLGEAIVNRLLTDAFFLAAPGIPVILEDRMDLVKELERRLGSLGACVVVGEPTTTREDHHFYGTKIVLSVLERPLINRSSSGSQKTGHQIAMQCWSLLGNWAPDEIWSPLKVQRLEPMRVSELPMIRELEIETSAATVEIAPDDTARHTAIILAPHENGGCVPMRLIGEEGSYQWEFGAWQDKWRPPLYALHKGGYAVPVSITGLAGAEQWVFGLPSPYLGGVEHFAPHSDGRIVPIQLVGSVEMPQWEYGNHL